MRQAYLAQPLSDDVPLSEISGFLHGWISPIDITSFSGLLWVDFTHGDLSSPSLDSPSSMLYLVAIFCPPLYFLIQKKWIAALFVSFVFVVSLAMFIVLPITWLVCAICAIWDLKKSLAKEHAVMVGTEVAKAIRRESAAGR